MRVSTSVLYALSVSAAAIMFAGCSGGSSQIAAPPVRSPGLQAPAAGTTGNSLAISCPRDRVYIADEGTKSIKIYPESVDNPSPCGTITNGIDTPGFIYVDTRGTLYVPNIGNNTVTEYPRNQTVPSVTLTGLADPERVFVGSDGTLYVSEPGPNEVLEFAPGAASPTRTISIPFPLGVATDNCNNLYVVYAPSFNSFVMEFKPRATTGKELGIVNPGANDIKLTKNGDIVLGNQRANFSIDIYPPGKTKPSRSIAVPVQPQELAFNQSETLLYVATFSPGVNVYDFQTGAQVGTFNKGLTGSIGVALDPPAQSTDCSCPAPSR